MQQVSPFILSIEPTEGAVIQHGFHLGTDEQLARELAEEMYNYRKHDTKTVALIRDGKVFDVFDGEWSSMRVFDCSQEGYR